MFIIDLIALVPWEYVAMGIAGETSVDTATAHYLSILKWLKLVSGGVQQRLEAQAGEWWRGSRG